MIVTACTTTLPSFESQPQRSNRLVAHFFICLPVLLTHITYRAHILQSGDESERYDDTVSALDVAIEIKSDGFVALVATPPDVVVQNAVDIGVSRVSFAREKMSSGELYYWCFNATPSSSDDTTADEHDFSDRVF